jgi:hypothetical protein
MVTSSGTQAFTPTTKMPVSGPSGAEIRGGIPPAPLTPLPPLLPAAVAPDDPLMQGLTTADPSAGPEVRWIHPALGAAGVLWSRSEMTSPREEPSTLSNPSETGVDAQPGLHWRLPPLAAGVRSRDPLGQLAAPQTPPENAEKIWTLDIDLQEASDPSPIGTLRPEMTPQRAGAGPAWNGWPQPTPGADVAAPDVPELQGLHETSTTTPAAEPRNPRAPDSSAASGVQRPPGSPDVHQRAEQQQNQADKMGQAIGQRMLSEIEKGHWHLRMMLKPVQLGHIEVEMRLRNGELDAQFTVAQSMTRELLQEGLGRLRDTLTQMGMDVANMQINTGFGRAGGGDSTPGKRPSSPNGAVAKDPDKVLTGPAAVKERRQGPDGWDVMV